MGAVSRDLEKKAREYDELYQYNREGITKLLQDIHSVKESRIYHGDIDATAILADLFTALDSDCLTARMRQVVALYYFAGLIEKEMTLLLGINQKSINEIKQKAVDRVAEHMYRGGKFKAGNPYVPFADDRVLYRWLNAVADGQLPVYTVTQTVFNDINRILAPKDKKAAEVLRQQREDVIFVEEPDVDEYPCLTEDQFAWADRRVTYVEEVYPPSDVVGTRKVAIKLRDDKKGREYIVEKRKMFKRRGN